MQKSRILFLAAVLVGAALITSVSGAFALGTGALQSLWAGQSTQQQYVVSGVIQAKNGDVWTVDGKDYRVDPNSIKGGATNVGDTVSLTVSVVHNNAPLQAAATLTPGPKGEITGVVSAIDATSITIDGVVYMLSANSEMHKIMVGDKVKLEYSTSTDGTLTVHEVEAFKNKPGGTSTHMDDKEITGVVSAIDATSITIDGVVYMLSANSEMHKVMVGDTVKLEYSTSSDGSLTAHEVEVSGGSGSSSEDQYQMPGTTGKHHDSEDQHGSSGMGQNNNSGYHDDDDEDDSYNSGGNSNGAPTGGQSSSSHGGGD